MSRFELLETARVYRRLEGEHDKLVIAVSGERNDRWVLGAVLIPWAEPVPICIGCGRAGWKGLRNRGSARVCAMCPDHTERWDRGERTLAIDLSSFAATCGGGDCGRGLGGCNKEEPQASPASQVPTLTPAEVDRLLLALVPSVPSLLDLDLSALNADLELSRKLRALRSVA